MTTTAATALVIALTALGAAGPPGVAAGSIIGGILVLRSQQGLPRSITRLAGAAFMASALNDLLRAGPDGFASPSPLVMAPAVVAGVFVLARLGRTHLIEGLVDGLLAVLAVVVLLKSPVDGDALPTSTIFMLGELTFVLAVWGRVTFTRRRLPPAGLILFGALAAGAAAITLIELRTGTLAPLAGGLHGMARGLAVAGLAHPSIRRLLAPSHDQRRALPRTLVLLTVAGFVGVSVAIRIGPSDVMGAPGSALVLLLIATLAARVAVAMAGQREAEHELHERRSRDLPTGLFTANHLGQTYIDVDDRAHDHLVLLRVQGLRHTLRSLPPMPAADLARELATRVRSLAPAEAHAARGDEDELLVVMAGDPIGATRELLAGLRLPIELPSSGATVSVEVVAAVVALDSSPFSLSLEQARYAAELSWRGEQRGRLVRYDGAVERDRTRSAAIIDALPAAVAEGAIAPYFQPIVEVTTGHVLGFETLARWTDPTLGQVAPTEFIPLAEATGAIAELGRRLTEQACHQLARWRHLPGHADLYISVNLSPLQLTDDLDRWLQAVIDQTDVKPSSLVLEITEGVLVKGTPGVDVPAVIERVRALGVRIAIDDFGTGYSSLAYLQRFRPDVVKIDRSFTQRLGTVDGDVASSIFAMLGGLGWDVIAEGIEHQTTADLLTKLSCGAGQGWLWSPAVDADEATDLLVSRAEATPLLDLSRAFPG